MKIFNNKQKGFTLIELLVVISIISLLSTVVLTATSNARKKARDKKRLEQVHQISTAINLYVNDNNQTYPSSGSTWKCLGHTSAQTCWVGAYSGNDSLNNQLNSYIKVPDDPLNATSCSGDAYLYHSNYTGLTPNGAYLHWQYEDTSTLGSSACGRGVAGATNSCGGTCWLYLGLGNP